MWTPDILARFLNTNFTAVCQGKEKFWRMKHGDDTVIFLYVHSLMCMQVRVCQFSTQTACWGQVTIPLMWQISPGITFLSAICHLVRSGRRAAKGQVSTVSLLICKMKCGVGESMSTSGVQQAKPRLVQVSQADVIGSFYVAVGASIMLHLAEIWHCRRHKSWIIMFEGVPWKWK